MWRVVINYEIVDAILVNARSMTHKTHTWKWSRFSRQLLSRLFQVIQIQVGIASDPY